jgi:hypothetical protein
LEPIVYASRKTKVSGATKVFFLWLQRHRKVHVLLPLYINLPTCPFDWINSIRHCISDLEEDKSVAISLSKFAISRDSIKLLLFKNQQECAEITVYGLRDDTGNHVPGRVVERPVAEAAFV